MKEYVGFSVEIEAKELPKLCQLLLIAGFDPEAVFEAIKERLDVLTDYREDIDEVCAIVKVFLPFMDAGFLIHLTSKAVHKSANSKTEGDGNFLLNLYKEWDEQGLPPDPVIFFLEYCLSWPEYTQRHFSELLEAFGLKANDLLRRLNGETLENLGYYYHNFSVVKEDGIDNFFWDFKVAGGDVDALADKFVRNYDFSDMSATKLMEYRKVLKKHGVTPEIIDRI